MRRPKLTAHQEAVLRDLCRLPRGEGAVMHTDNRAAAVLVRKNLATRTGPHGIYYATDAGRLWVACEDREHKEVA